MIKSMNDLNSVLQKYIIQALELTRDEIFEIVSNKIVDYYNEPVFDNIDPTKPKYYQRTGRMLESLSSSAIMQDGDGYKFTVGFDRNYLTFHYPKGFTQSGNSDKFNDVTGLDVLQWMNDESHGGTVSGEHSYWDEAIEEIKGLGGFRAMFKRNCKKVGLPIK